MNFGRKNVIQNELADEKRIQEEQRKKAEYQRVLREQMEAAERKKKEEKEAKIKREREELEKENAAAVQAPKFKQFKVEEANPFKPAGPNKPQAAEPKKQVEHSPPRTVQPYPGPEISIATPAPRTTAETPREPFQSLSGQPPREEEPRITPFFPGRHTIDISENVPAVATPGTKHAARPSLQNLPSESRAALVQFRNQIDEYLNRQIDSLNSLANSTQNCINTSLSKNYVLKHKNTDDYSTIANPGHGYAPFFTPGAYPKNAPTLRSQGAQGGGPSDQDPFQMPARPSRTDQNETQLLNRLAELKKKAIVLANETDEKKLELLRLQNEFRRIQKCEQEKSEEVIERVKRGLEDREEQNLIYSYLAMEQSRQLNGETDWVSFVGKDWEQTLRSQPPQADRPTPGDNRADGKIPSKGPALWRQMGKGNWEVGRPHLDSRPHRHPSEVEPFLGH